MRKSSFLGMNCSIAQTLEIVGEWWTLLILRDAMFGIRRFDDFVDRPGISRNALADRPDKLVVAGVLDRRPYDEGRGRYDYVLTEKGRDLWVVLSALREWGDRWILGEGNEPIVLEHRECGEVTGLRHHCEHCGEELHAHSVVARPGPGAHS